MKKSILKSLSQEKMLNINKWIVVGVCAFFSIFNVLLGLYSTAVYIIIIGCFIACALTLFKNKISLETRIIIVTLGQYLIIFFISLSKGGLHEMYALYLASCIMAAVYFNRRIIVIQSIVIISTLLSSFLIFDKAYVGADFSVVTKETVAVVIGVAFVNLVVTWGNGFINDGKLKAAEAERLLRETKLEAEKREEMSQKQREIVDGAREGSSDILKVYQELNEIVQEINSGAILQRQAVEKVNLTTQQLHGQAAQTGDACGKSRKLSVAADT